MKYKELEKVAVRSFYTIRRIGVHTIIEHESLICNQINRITIDETQEDTIYIDVLAFNPNDLEVLTSALAYAETPLDCRQEEKIYIVPLPHLILSDGLQIYLTQTHQGNFFPSIRDKTLKQTWKEKDLNHIPEEYRDFAVEMEKEEWKNT